MVPHVLGVGYAYNEYEVTAGRWKEFEIEFDYAIYAMFLCIFVQFVQREIIQLKMSRDCSQLIFI